MDDNKDEDSVEEGGYRVEVVVAGIKESGICAEDETTSYIPVFHAAVLPPPRSDQREMDEQVRPGR